MFWWIEMSKLCWICFLVLCSHQWRVDWSEWPCCAWYVHLGGRTHSDVHLLGSRATKQPRSVQWRLCRDVVPGERKGKKQPYTLVKCILCYKDKIWPMCNLHGKIQAVHIINSLQWNVVILMLISSLLQTGRWNDVSCAELNTYICKMPKAHYPMPSVKPTVYGCPQVGKKILTLIFLFSFQASSHDASWKRFTVHVV